MIKRNKFVLIILLMISLLVACNNAQTTVPIEEDLSESKELEQKMDDEELDDESETDEITIMDMAGREVVVPSVIDRVFGTNNNSSIMLYTLAPQKMIAWNIKFNEKSAKFIQSEIASLPVVGNLFGSGKKANIEEVLLLNPDIALITNTVLNDKVIDSANKLEKQLGIPVVVVIANVENYNEAYEFLGSLLEEQEKAETLSNYYLNTMQDISEKKEAIGDGKLGVYYARMDNGLTTEFDKSLNAELIPLIGAENIAVGADKQTSGEVTIEQVADWNPDIIIVGQIGQGKSMGYETIMSDKVWGEISAVDDGSVYNIPRYPFNWFDRPPSVNRIIGIKWLANTVYPEVYQYDMVDEVKEFFKLFYGYDLSNEKAEELLK